MEIRRVDLRLLKLRISLTDNTNNEIAGKLSDENLSNNIDCFPRRVDISFYIRLTLTVENSQMIEDRRLQLASLTSCLCVQHLQRIISSLNYPQNEKLRFN